MTAPNVPLRMAFSVEVPGTPEQVWEAIATANGISSWFLPADVEEREGGAIVLHMGETDLPGTITGWDPPRRLEYAESQWVPLTGQVVDSITPMITEFLIEAQSSSTCVVRVDGSAFGTGAAWEQEFFDEVKEHWLPFFDNLRLYLTHFPGQRVTAMEVATDVPGAAGQVFSALLVALGAATIGKLVDTRDVTGQVERIGSPPGPHELLLRVTDPVPGFMNFMAHDKGTGSTMVALRGYLFSGDASGYIEREQQAWKAWLQNLAIPAA
jgi:uncharacterized protein YndB with AHSA1/START domain